MKKDVTAVFGGLLVTAVVSGLLLLLGHGVWRDARPTWVWLAALLLGTVAGGAAARRLAPLAGGSLGGVTGLVAGLLVLATAVWVSDLAVRTTLGGAAYLIISVVGATLGARLSGAGAGERPFR